MGFRFSLKTLLATMGAVSAVVAVLTSQPDRNNTLPIRALLAGKALAAPPGAAQPELLVQKTATMSMPQGLQLQVVDVVLVNDTPSVVRYNGYPPGPQERGRISPSWTVLVKEKGAWVRMQLGWCGTGMEELMVAPGHAGRFDAHVPAPVVPFKIGLTCRWIDQTGATHNALILSQELDP